MMKSDRKSLLKRLYDGEFFPVERIAPGDPDYASTSHKAGGEMEYIASRLEGEDNVRFQGLIDLMGDLEAISGYGSFAYGLHTGILLMFELFFNEDDPPFREHD